MKGRTPQRTAAGEVPPELLDLGADVWRDANLFAEWCRENGIGDLPRADDWYRRFRLARDTWAHRNGFTTITGVSGQVSIDQGRMRDAGIPWAGSLTRAVCRAELTAADPAAYRASCRLQPYGDGIDQYPAWAVG